MANIEKIDFAHYVVIFVKQKYKCLFVNDRKMGRTLFCYINI